MTNIYPSEEQSKYILQRWEELGASRCRREKQQPSYAVNPTQSRVIRKEVDSMSVSPNVAPPQCVNQPLSPYEACRASMRKILYSKDLPSLATTYSIRRSLCVPKNSSF